MTKQNFAHVLIFHSVNIPKRMDRRYHPLRRVSQGMATNGVAVIPCPCIIFGNFHDYKFTKISKFTSKSRLVSCKI